MTGEKHNLYSDLDPNRGLLGKWLTQEYIDSGLGKKARPDMFPPAYRRNAQAIIGCFRERGACDIVTVYDYMTEKMHATLEDKGQLMALGECGVVGGNEHRLYELVCRNNGEPGVTLLSLGAEEFLQGDVKPVPWAVEGIWPEGTSGPLAGPEKVGKSWLCCELALSLSTGIPFLGKYRVPRPFRVLYWEEEDSRTRLHRRVHQLLAGRSRAWPTSEQIRFLVGHGLKLDSKQGLMKLENEITAFQPEFITVGNLREVHSKDENRPEMATIRDTFRRLSREHTCAFIVLHHFRKHQEGQSKRGSQMLAGSGVWGAWAESWLYVNPGESEDVCLVETGSKDAPGVGRLVVQRRDVTDGAPLARDEETDEAVWPVTLSVVGAQMRSDESRSKILDAIREIHAATHEGVTMREIIARCGLSRRTVVARLPELEAAKLVQMAKLHNRHFAYYPATQ